METWFGPMLRVLQVGQSSLRTGETAGASIPRRGPAPACTGAGVQLGSDWRVCSNPGSIRNRPEWPGLTNHSCVCVCVRTKQLVVWGLKATIINILEISLHIWTPSDVRAAGRPAQPLKGGDTLSASVFRARPGLVRG